MSVAVLKDLCVERDIRRIAIVDDVFDVPDPLSLDNVHYSNFRRKFNSAQDLKQAVERAGGTIPEELPRFEDLTEEQLAPFWIATWKHGVGGHKFNTDQARALHDLFYGHYALSMLDDVNAVVSFFRDDLNLRESVTVHGTDYDPDEIADAQIVVVDFFLGQNLSAEQAFKGALEVVTNVVRATRSARKAIPSFLLVSARPNDINIEKFRKSAELMKSRFRFFAKEDLHHGRIRNMVNLHDLIDASGRTETIERLIDDWQNGAKKAISAVRKRMLSLDISDFAFLDCYRLKHEDKSVAQYLRWFLTASLNATVTRKLSKQLWHTADELRLYSLVNEDGELDEKTLAKTYEGPSDLIARAYGEILFDETRGTGNWAFPAQPTGHDLVEGDLFVCPNNGDGRKYNGAEVLLVITPSCDLVRRGPRLEPSAKNVLLLPGVLRQVDQEDKKSNFADVNFLPVKECGASRALQITWDFQKPITIDWHTLKDKGPGKNFKRLGRIRELHFHRIRDEFANRVTRIGTEVAPLLPHPRNGQALIAVRDENRRKFEPVFCFDSTDKYVWEIGPVRLTLPNGKTDMKYVYQASPEFVDRLTDALVQLPINRPHLKESAERSVRNLQDIQTYMDLIRPIEPGLRGVNGAVEFKKTVSRSNVKLNSNANLLVVTFID